MLRKIGLTLVLLFLVSGCNPAVEITPTSTSLPASPVLAATVAATATLPPPDTPLPPTQSAPTSTPSPAQVGAPASAAIIPAKVYMIDPANGWGLRENRVGHTVNGGKTWQNVTPAEAAASQDSLSGYFLDANTAWVILPGAQDSGSGQVFHTVNGGAAWTPVSAPFGYAVLQALDPKTLFAMADRGAAAGSQAVDIYRSDDAGATWTQVTHVDPQGDNPNSLPFGGDKSGMVFRDIQHGWVTGFEPVDGFSYLFATQDGGKTWAQQPLALGDFSKAQVELEQPRFFSPKEGLILAWLLTAEGRYLDVVTTQDGGATWNMTTPVKATGPFAAGGPADFYAWNEAMLLTSHDGGKTWNPVPGAAPGEQPSYMQFVDAGHGWLTLDDNGLVRLYGSTDQGSLWDLLVEDTK